jgi:hypothetical protein
MYWKNANRGISKAERTADFITVESVARSHPPIYIKFRSKITVGINTKGGHPQFKSAPPQLRNIADNHIDCGVAD